MDYVTETNEEIIPYRFAPPPEVASAISLVGFAPTVNESCGQPTKLGRPCMARRHKLLLTCRLHASAADRAALESAEREARHLIDAWLASCTPACWDWPVTDADHDAIRAHGALMGMWLWQDGRCAVCGLPSRDDLVRDHDHDTGLIRGYLCMSCNLTEPGGVGEFRLYRERNPATILGVRIVYTLPWDG